MAALEAQRPDLKGRLEIRRDSMRDAVPDWEAQESAWVPLVSAYELPDPDDRHVLAAAVAGHADCIVTANLRDFPTAVVGAYGIEVIDPDRFILNQWDLDPVTVMAAFKHMRARRKKPEATRRGFRAGIGTGLAVRDCAENP